MTHDDINNLNINNPNLYNIVKDFLVRIYNLSPDKITLLNTEDVSTLYENEVTIEWIIKNYYVKVDIREDETRMLAKLKNGEKFIKVHPNHRKIINGTIQSLDKILAYG